MNGWQRLCAVFTIAWVILVAAFGLVVWLSDRETDSVSALFIITTCFATIPPGIVYAFGIGIGWAIRGFGGEEERNWRRNTEGDERTEGWPVTTRESRTATAQVEPDDQLSYDEWLARRKAGPD